MREVKLGSSLGAGNDTAVHFGLGRSRITGLEIVCPGPGNPSRRRSPRF